MTGTRSGLNVARIRLVFDARNALYLKAANVPTFMTIDTINKAFRHRGRSAIKSPIAQSLTPLAARRKQ